MEGVHTNEEGPHQAGPSDEAVSPPRPVQDAAQSDDMSSAEADFAYVYAIGRVEPRLPSLAIEREFAQVAARADTSGMTDQQMLESVITQPESRYLARRLCWVFLIEGMETYILVPRDPLDLDRLVESVRGGPTPLDLDLVIGERGPLAPPQACSGLTVPLVAFDQLYSFDRDSMIESIPRPEGMSKREEERFRAAAGELFDRVMQLTDNAGATDEHRALNYLAVRYEAIYARTAEAYLGNASLTSVDVRPSRLSGVRKLVDVIFSYTHRETDVVEKAYVRVDVTEAFPFLASKLAPYYDR